MEDEPGNIEGKGSAAHGRFDSIPLERRAFIKGVLLTGILAVPAVQILTTAPKAHADTTSASSSVKPTKPTYPTKPTTPSSTTTEQPTTSSTTTLPPTTSTTTTQSPTSSSTTTQSPAVSSASSLPQTGDDATPVAAVAGMGLAGLTLAAFGAAFDEHKKDED